MKSNHIFLFVFILLLAFACTESKRSTTPKVLVFSKTAGFVHQSIPDGIKAIQEIGAKEGFAVDVTEEDSVFTEENLAQYAAVVFLNTTGDVLHNEEELVFERYIQAGGGFVGVHAATDTEYGWPWYGRLVGAYFDSHPKIQEAHFQVKDHECSACSSLPDSDWVRTDELYNFKNLNPDVNVILSIDEDSYEGGNMQGNHPMSWYHEFDGGRAFYTALGHTSESYSEPEYLAHLTDGIKYAIGDNAPPDYSKCTTQLPPNQARFSKNILTIGAFTEPTEMTILPNKDVLIAQRGGELMRYQEATKSLKQVGYLDVYSQSGVQGVNAEEGFMGLQKDPDFANNHWIYAFYSPKEGEWVNRLSRFKFEDDTLKLETEQIILEVGSQRQICCHTGGSIAFGPDNMLYLSTGDNSTPFNERGAAYINSGFAPLNDLPGKEQYDARRSSGNTNDLRGKILRIKVNDDGTYSIPEGNLFPEGTEKTRPEIYTMGHRNPYRISVDPKDSRVFWGEVGPDAREDSMSTRGPRGYDEVNMAQKAGNFGWPLFIGDNYAYRDYDYQTGEHGSAFDPAGPINDSRYNTGLQKLPPTQPAMIYYPYNVSPLFGDLASGGRNAMAGPVYYTDMYSGDNKLPAYYDKKLIIYDWIRGWMKAVTFFEDGTMRHMEPFADGVKVNNLIDMELGPDGQIYLLEYGSGWFSKNADSGLSILEFNDGNLPPTIEDFEVDVTSGEAPLTAAFKVEATDTEDGALTYKWHISADQVRETKVPTLEHTFAETGFYSVYVEVVDDKDQSVISKKIPIVSGNTKPKVAIELEGTNSQFLLPGLPVRYKVTVTDAEDSTIDTNLVQLNIDYLEGFDQASLSPVGHQEVSGVELGKALIENGTCKACHKENEKSIGPSYTMVAERYQGQRRVRSELMAKIKAGGSGNWGEVAMPANPDLTTEDLSNVMQYIFSLTASKSNLVPLAGTIVPPAGQTGKTLVLTASYKDQGGENVVALTGMERKSLRSNSFATTEFIDLEGFTTASYKGRDFLSIPAEGGVFALEDLDLTSVGEVVVSIGGMRLPKVPLTLSIHKNSPDGELLGQGTFQAAPAQERGGAIHIPLRKAVNERVDKLYFVYQPTDAEKISPDAFSILTGVRLMPGVIQ